MEHQNKQHFSHHHILEPFQTDDGDTIKCDACEELIEEAFYGCLPCNFCLHKICLEAPRSIQHPSHLSHPLALHPLPTYWNRSYSCHACGSEGKAFSYSCAHCEFDLHLPCAALPETFMMEEEHPHELKLVFETSSNKLDETTEVIVCDICRLTENQGHWSYYCQECKFLAHIKCLESKYEEKERDKYSKVCVKGESSSDGKQEPADDDSTDEEEGGDKILENQMGMLEIGICYFSIS